MKITREKLIQAYGILTQLSQVKTTAKGAYGLIKNKKLVEVEVKNIEDAQKNLKYPNDLEEFHSKRIALCNEFADKDEEGKVKTEGSSFIISPESRVLFDAKFAELVSEYKETLDTQQKVDNDFRVFLAEEIEFTVYSIKIDDMPDDISAAQLEVLGDIVVD